MLKAQLILLLALTACAPPAGQNVGSCLITTRDGQQFYAEATDVDGSIVCSVPR
jgi:hypothetical protein